MYLPHTRQWGQFHCYNLSNTFQGSDCTVMDTKIAQLKKEIRAPRGTKLTCKGWHQEAAMRMLMNNLDPDVAEKPEELIV